jgi:hypothetical protein
LALAGVSFFLPLYSLIKTTPSARHIPHASSIMIPSTPKKRYLTRDQRLQIQTLHKTGFNYTDISHQLLIIFRQIEYARQASHPISRKRTGRPSILDE